MKISVFWDVQSCSLANIAYILEEPAASTYILKKVGEKNVLKLWRGKRRFPLQIFSSAPISHHLAVATIAAQVPLLIFPMWLSLLPWRWSLPIFLKH
jgi:hypothetical protein